MGGWEGMRVESNCQEVFWIFHLIPASVVFYTASRESVMWFRLLSYIFYHETMA